MSALINIVGTKAPFVCVATACHAVHACTLQEFLLAQLHKIAVLEYYIDGPPKACTCHDDAYGGLAWSNSDGYAMIMKPSYGFF